MNIKILYRFNKLQCNSISDGNFVCSFIPKFPGKGLRLCAGVKPKSRNKRHLVGDNRHSRTYADLKRQWSSSCPNNQLETLVTAAKSASIASNTVANLSSAEINKGEQSLSNRNLVIASHELFLSSIQRPNSGRTLYDSLKDEQIDTIHKTISALHPPVLMLTKETQNVPFAQADKNASTNVRETYSAFKSLDYNKRAFVASSQRHVSEQASNAMRQYLDLRNKLVKEDSQIYSLNRSLQYNRSRLCDLVQQRNILLANHSKQALLESDANRQQAAATLSTNLDETETNEQNCKRVIAQLERHIPPLLENRNVTENDLTVAQQKATIWYQERKQVFTHYTDPVIFSASPGRYEFKNNRIFANILIRPLGSIDRSSTSRSMIRSMGRIRPQGATTENYKALLYTRFSHAATINSHLHYPVYCLRFDRAGRYFITGADDYLVRVFCLGDCALPKNKMSKGKATLIDRSTCLRGAVLICTLKGHAGVINDICVSSDNSFLATASEDGDCRVWGLKDGCPIAVLRGHHGGANMVSRNQFWFNCLRCVLY